jgi:hypothetical protein
MSDFPKSDRSPTPPQTDVDRADAPEAECETFIQTDYLDYIDEVLEESMPVSDPPGWTPATSLGPPIHESEKDRA